MQIVLLMQSGKHPGTARGVNRCGARECLTWIRYDSISRPSVLELAAAYRDATFSQLTMFQNALT
ncbi:hypothetical protein GCM10009563_13240 [Subtercola frigoramans]